jgi:MFS transporter, UMF1 family
LLNLDDTKLIITVVIIQLVAIIGAIVMSRLSAIFGNIKVLIGVVVFWIFICVAAYRIATMAEPLNPFFRQIDKFKIEKESYKQADVKHVNGELIATLDAKIDAVKKEVEPKQTPVEYRFYLLAVAVGLVMGGIQSLSRSTYAKLMPDTKDTASFFSYYDVTEKIAIVIGMFSFGYIEELTGSMKNSILFLILFFSIGLFWLFSALFKQKLLIKI